MVWLFLARFGYRATMNDPTHPLTTIVAAALDRTGLGLTEFCRTYNVNPRTIYRWRQGDFVEPQIHMILKVAKALGVSYQVLSATLTAERSRAHADRRAEDLQQPDSDADKPRSTLAGEHPDCDGIEPAIVKL